MRTMILALAAATATMAFSAVPAAAEQTYPWCAQYEENGTNCGFTTLKQCMGALSGNGGLCEQNSLAVPAAPAATDRSQRRRIRAQAA
jgi:Protein of unknown function (DUF3551)